MSQDSLQAWACLETSLRFLAILGCSITCGFSSPWRVYAATSQPQELSISLHHYRVEGLYKIGVTLPPPGRLLGLGYTDSESLPLGARKAIGNLLAACGLPNEFKDEGSCRMLNHQAGSVPSLACKWESNTNTVQPLSMVGIMWQTF